MIKFFRKIRQQLLTENKFSKYLIYAIGEIILVVIGILIALSINNWNENNKLIKQELTYLQNLRDDLKAQIDLLDIYIACEDIIITQSSDIVKHYEINDGFHNMDSIFPKLNDLTVRWTFSNANTTLMEMINLGQINIIQNKTLKAELVAFNQSIEIFSKNTQNNNTNLIDNLTVPNLIIRNAYATHGYSDRMTDMFKKFYLFDFVRVKDDELAEISIKILNEPKERLELINKVAFRNTMASMQKKGNQSLKNLAEQILLNVNSEIDRK
jgi:hypothetical protein